MSEKDFALKGTRTRVARSKDRRATDWAILYIVKFEKN